MGSDLKYCYKSDLQNPVSVSPVNDVKTRRLPFKPRSALARSLHHKIEADNYLRNLDKSQWYECNLDDLPEHISSKFIPLNLDEATKEFLRISEEKSGWLFTQIWHLLAKMVLGFFMTQTSINGWLQRGSMFVVSSDQFLALIGERWGWRRGKLVDLGAGDGAVTAHLAPMFDQVFVTEISSPMLSLLHQKGYKLLSLDSWHLEQKFDFISCLNLLDRCENPIKLLRNVKDALLPNGMVILGVVLPFSPYVEFESPDHKPKETLPIFGYTFEEQVQSTTEILKSLGFEVVSWSRVPYLSEGDLLQSYYWLDEAIFILNRID